MLQLLPVIVQIPEFLTMLIGHQKYRELAKSTVGSKALISALPSTRVHVLEK